MGNILIIVVSLSRAVADEPEPSRCPICSLVYAGMDNWEHGSTYPGTPTNINEGKYFVSLRIISTMTMSRVHVYDGL